MPPSNALFIEYEAPYLDGIFYKKRLEVFATGNEWLEPEPQLEVAGDRDESRMFRAILSGGLGPST